MIKILTIEREYGSGAAEIARKLPDRLGWKLWDQLLTDEIARHAKSLAALSSKQKRNSRSTCGRPLDLGNIELLHFEERLSHPFDARLVASA